MEGVFQEIEDFLISNSFTKIEGEEVAYTRKFEIPERKVIVNGQQVHTQKQYFDFIIKYLGEGAILDIDNVPTTPLYGYNMANNDIWVESSEDFKYWLSRIFAK